MTVLLPWSVRSPRRSVASVGGGVVVGASGGDRRRRGCRWWGGLGRGAGGPRTRSRPARGTAGGDRLRRRSARPPGPCRPAAHMTARRPPFSPPAPTGRRPGRGGGGCSTSTGSRPRPTTPPGLPSVCRCRQARSRRAGVVELRGRRGIGHAPVGAADQDGEVHHRAEHGGGDPGQDHHHPPRRQQHVRGQAVPERVGRDRQAEQPEREPAGEPTRRAPRSCAPSHTSDPDAAPASTTTGSSQARAGVNPHSRARSRSAANDSIAAAPATTVSSR